MSDDDLVASPSSNNNSPSPSSSPAPASRKNELVAHPPPPTIPPASTRPAAPPARTAEVANAVNALHGHTKKQYRTDIQCKNRIDTLKKKYKIEKARVSQSHGRYVPQWPFFNGLDALIGDNFKPSPSPVTVAPRRKTPPLLPPPPSAVPLQRLLRSEDSDEERESETSSPATFTSGPLSRRKESGALAEGCSRLAEAIGRFAEIYERVEDAKQRQMVELEKQRMQFAKFGDSRAETHYGVTSPA
ncbi:hypothetical protein HAX54_043260 [Datura stramonium]|uniref:Myb/SANT-like DNA-binding domain-containing protein n=1 Tax=Datura stramonium TaxID=4076 RepID=A0ABS8W107_DATST|nr:hypothetical protein [Datura stramonium]